MAEGRLRFDRFILDTGERRLLCDGATVELTGRYFDALALLAGEAGRLITKDRFLEQVWRGVPVTDEALTQCIRTLRRQRGDKAADPRFIETVPKHGYRFIAPVDRLEPDAPPPPIRVAGDEPERPSWEWRTSLVGGAGGGALAGVFGGLFYGSLGATQPTSAGMGGLSVLLVLLVMNMVLGLVAGAGVGFGIAAAVWIRRAWWVSVAGGALGGLIVGALVELIGLDAFALLFGQSPGDMTGAAEGTLLGGAVGLGVWVGGTDARARLRRGIAAGAAAGVAAGVLITLAGGRLMGGSLALLGRRFPGSRFDLDRVGIVFGENTFGPISHLGTSAVEGLVFAGCTAGAMVLVGTARGTAKLSAERIRRA